MVKYVTLFQKYQLVILAIIIGIIPFLVSTHWLSALVLIGIFGIAILGLDVVFGMAGQLSLAQSAFVGIGAYSTAILTTRYDLNPFLAIVVGMLVTYLVSHILGFFVLKLRGSYFVLATLTLGIVFELLVLNWTSFSGGPSGITGIPTLKIRSMAIGTDMRYYYLVWVILWLLFLVLRNLTKHNTFLAWKAVARDELAAAAVGVDVRKMKQLAFTISAICGSVSGSLLGHYLQFVSPEMVSIQVAFNFVVMVVLGGLGTLYGPLLGVIILRSLPEIISVLDKFQLMVSGLVLILVLRFFPKGVFGFVQDLIRNRGGQ